jgi:hypothetical protein
MRTIKSLTNAEATEFLTWMAGRSFGDTVLDLFELYCDDDAVFALDYGAFKSR